MEEHINVMTTSPSWYRHPRGCFTGGNTRLSQNTVRMKPADVTGQKVSQI
jgi:hypothetical protein